MGDKTEQPGPSEAAKKFTPEPDGTDVEGHRKVAKLTDDEPGPSEAGRKYTETDDDDVEGHIFAK